MSDNSNTDWAEAVYTTGTVSTSVGYENSASKLCFTHSLSEKRLNFINESKLFHE